MRDIRHGLLAVQFKAVWLENVVIKGEPHRLIVPSMTRVGGLGKIF